MKYWVILMALFCSQAIAHPGIGIVMDSRGNVYYTDLKQIWKIDTQGKKSVAVPHVHSHELYIDHQDNLFGEHLWYNGERLNTWGHYVWRLSTDGKLEKIIPPTEGFLTNYSFVRDKMGNMYFADRGNECQKVIRKNSDGTITRLGDECLSNIRWMNATKEGLIFLIDLYDLKKIDLNGHVTLVASQLQEKALLNFFIQDQHAIMGLCTDHEQNVYATIASGNKIKKISATGKVSEFAKTSIPWSPSGILSAPNGEFWILEYSISGAVRVEKITATGTRIIY